MVFKYLALMPFYIAGILIAGGDPDDNMKNNSEKRITMQKPVSLSPQNKERFRSNSDLRPLEKNPTVFLNQEKKRTGVIPLYEQNQNSNKKPKASGATQ